MLELRDDGQRQEYVENLWHNIFGDNPKLKISYVEGGILNYVYSAQSGKNIIYLKQALQKTKHESTPPAKQGWPSRFMKNILNWPSPIRQT